MYNLRYHLITVVAIFFALAVGLLLGAAVGGSEALRQTSSSLVENLRKDYTEAIKKRDELAGKLEENDKFTGEFVKNWMTNRLQGKNIVLFTDSDSTACAERIDDLVASAGGTLSRITLTKDDLTEDKYKSLRAELKTLLNVQDESKIRQELSRRLIEEWNEGALRRSSSNPIWDLITSKTNIAQQDQQPARANSEKPQTPDNLGSDTAQQKGGISDENQTDAAVAAHNTQPSNDQKEIHQSTAHPITEFALKNKLITIHTSGDVGAIDGVVTCAVVDKNKPSLWALELTSIVQAQKIPAVVTQLGTSDDDLIVEAQSRGFSSMAACDTLVGGYGVIALLTGAQGGSYGLEGMVAYPPLP